MSDPLSVQESKARLQIMTRCPDCDCPLIITAPIAGVEISEDEEP